MLRSFYLALIILATVSLAAAQSAKDPFLRHRTTRSEKRLQKSGGAGSKVTPVIASGTKPASVDTQLNQIARESVKSSPSSARRSGSPVFPKTRGPASANPPINFQYHPPKATVTAQPTGGGAGRSQAVMHRAR